MLPPLLGMAAFGDGMGSGSTSLVNYTPSPVVAPVGAGPPPSTDEELAGVARRQAEAYLRVAAAVSRAHAAAGALRGRCRRWAAMRGGDDPFARADAAEAEEERKLQERIRSEVAAAAGSIGTAAAAAAAAPAPATGGGLFGTPAPAPAGGGLFGTPAPAPAGGGLFGAAPAPAPAAGGGLFGAPAPAAGAAPAFGAAAAPAFGAAAAPATSTVRSKSRSRGSRRR